jgi:hypothetical protein
LEQIIGVFWVVLTLFQILRQKYHTLPPSNEIVFKGYRQILVFNVAMLERLNTFTTVQWFYLVIANLFDPQE